MEQRRDASQGEFLRHKAMAGEDRTLRRYLKPDLLIIDDMGPKQLPRNSAEYLSEVAMRRYENRSTIMTSNRPIEEWGKLLGDVPAVGAILDRFLHHAEVIPHAGTRSLAKHCLLLRVCSLGRAPYTSPGCYERTSMATAGA